MKPARGNWSGNEGTWSGKRPARGTWSRNEANEGNLVWRKASKARSLQGELGSGMRENWSGERPAKGTWSGDEGNLRGQQEELGPRRCHFNSEAI